MPPTDLCYEDFAIQRPSPSKYGSHLHYWVRAIDEAALSLLDLRNDLDEIIVVQDEPILDQSDKLLVMVKPTSSTKAESLDTIFRSHTETWKTETIAFRDRIAVHVLSEVKPFAPVGIAHCVTPTLRRLRFAGEIIF